MHGRQQHGLEGLPDLVHLQGTSGRNERLPQVLLQGSGFQRGVQRIVFS